MGRILAIDYGKKRVGLAISDPTGMIANGLDTIPAKDIWNYLDDYIHHKEQIDCIVIGDPKQMNNAPSEAVEFVYPFIKNCRKRYPDIRVELIDERFTSQIAFQSMIDGGMKKKQRQDKAMIDKISASIILQNYLDQK